MKNLLFVIIQILLTSISFAGSDRPIDKMLPIGNHRILSFSCKEIVVSTPDQIVSESPCKKILNKEVDSPIDPSAGVGIGYNNYLDEYILSFKTQSQKNISQYLDRYTWNFGNFFANDCNLNLEPGCVLVIKDSLTYIERFKQPCYRDDACITDHYDFYYRKIFIRRNEKSFTLYSKIVDGSKNDTFNAVSKGTGSELEIEFEM